MYQVLLHPSYTSRLGLTSADEVFEYLQKTLKSDRPTAPSYFVNWSKALSNTERIEMYLHQLDYVLGKEDMSLALYQVIRANPAVVEALPSIFAARESRYLLVSKSTGPTEFQFLASAMKSDKDVKGVVAFCEEIGLLEFLKDAAVTNFTDFVHGVEVGIDTNGRKNRGGKQMEDSVEEFVSAICEASGYQYITQATAAQIEDVFRKQLRVDKVNRRFDFAVNTPHRLYLLETNYYGGGGSKLKATAGEYITLFDLVRSSGHQFIWITDGNGWKSTLNSLRETFDYVDHVLNLEMVSQGILGDLLAP